MGNEQSNIASVIMYDDLIEGRDHKGSDWCIKKGVGALRARLERKPHNVIPAFASEADEAWRVARLNALDGLTAICRSCPLRCELAGR